MSKTSPHSMLKTIAPISAFALVCGTLLAIVYYFAAPLITAQQHAYKTQQLQAVLGNEQYQIVPLNAADEDKGYVLIEDALPVGELVQLTTYEGYNGEITFWLAIRKPMENAEPQAEVIGVRIIKHQETPGLGDKLDLAVSDWVLGFEGSSLTATNWDVKKYGGDFDQFSGATITPRAVVLRIKEHLMQTQRQLNASDKTATQND